MGKGVKRKNAGVGVDFRRVKHKVGKKLPKAQNQTDTSFKSRSITLPDQSVLQDKTGAAVTHRNLTLKDLLGQCGHYSEKVRREAVRGLGELLVAHPLELTRHTTLVVETLAERITDGDKGVRGALRDTLASPILPSMGRAALGPFVPLFMAHVCSAMTHLSDQIRVDALGFLELLSEWRPDLIATSFLAPALHHFGDLVSKGSRGRSLSAGSLAALHRTVAALEKLLRRLMGVGAAAGGISAATSSMAARGAGFFGSPGGLGERRLPLFRRLCDWPPLEAAAAFRGSEAPAAEEQGEAGAGGGGAAEEAGRKLLGNLLECWSDCGPAQLAQMPDLALAQCLLCTLRCCNHLLSQWGAGLAGNPADKSSLAASLLKRVPPLFPVQRPSVPVPPAAAEALVQMNVAAAQLLARFLPSQLRTAADTSGDEGGWAGRLLDWFEGVMREESGALPDAGGEAGLFNTRQERAQFEGTNTGRKKGREATASQHLPPEVYETTLEGVAGVLPLVGGARRRQLLGAMWALWERSAVRSATRAQVLLCWRRLLADPATTFYTPLPPSGEPMVFPAEALQWLQAMPRFLWELGPSFTATTEGALRLLLDGARFACCAAPGELIALQQQMAPLFATLLPAAAVQGKSKQGTQQAQQAHRMLPGPLARQPLHVQQLAVDILLHLPTLQESTLKIVALCCLSDVYSVDISIRLLEVVSHKAPLEGRSLAGNWAALHTLPSGSQQQEGSTMGEAQSGEAGVGAFAGMLLCLLSGISKAGVERAQQGDPKAQLDSWRRHEAVVGAASRVLLSCDRTGALSEALAGPLLDLCETLRSPRPLYGVLATGAALAAAAEGPAGTALSGHSGPEGGCQQKPPALAAELPGVMLCYAALCDAAQQIHSSQVAAAGGAPSEGQQHTGTETHPQSEQQRGATLAPSKWLPPLDEALALSVRLMHTLPSLLSPTLDLINAVLATAQEAQRGSSGDTSAPATSAATCISGSRVVGAWMQPIEAPAPTVAQQGVSGGYSKGIPLVSWVSAAVQLLEAVLQMPSGGGDTLRGILLEREEQRGEAALQACEVAVRKLESEVHPSAGSLRQGVDRAKALFATLFGRDS